MNFFSRLEQVSGILNSWMSKNNSPTAQKTVLKWAKKAVVEVVLDKAKDITKVIMEHEFNAMFMLGLNFDTLATIVEEHCPVTMLILQCMVITNHQEKKMQARRS